MSPKVSNMQHNTLHRLTLLPLLMLALLTGQLFNTKMGQNASMCSEKMQPWLKVTETSINILWGIDICQIRAPHQLCCNPMAVQAYGWWDSQAIVPISEWYR